MKNNTELQKNMPANEIADTAKDVIVSINDIKKNDTEITSEILNAFKWTQEVPDKKISVKVENGWVTLEGEVHWNFQSAAAKNTAKKIFGVTGISNKLKVITPASDTSEKADIEIALKRNLSVYDRNIRVDVVSNRVTLTGKVNSEFQKNEAGRVAVSIAGVGAIDNNLVVTEPGNMISKKSEKII